MNKCVFNLLMLAIISLVITSGCTEKEAPYSQQEATQLAKLVMEGAPMYKFDGFDLELVNVTTLDEEYTWQFDYTFKCKNDGYGDRAREFVAHVTTPHNSTLVVQNGSVIYAVVDRTWDILNREFVQLLD